MIWSPFQTIVNISEMSQQTHDDQQIGKSYINTRRQSLPRELQLEIKLIDTDIESSLPTQSDLVLEQRSVAVAKILGLSGVARRGQPEIRQWVICAIWALEDSNKAMKADCEMRQPYGFDNSEHDSTPH